MQALARLRIGVCEASAPPLRTLETKATYQGPGEEPQKYFVFWFVFGAISWHLRTLTLVATKIQFDGEVAFGYIANVLGLTE